MEADFQNEAFSRSERERELKAYQASESCGLEFNCGCCKMRRRRVKILDFFCNAKAALFCIAFGAFLQGLEVSGLFSIVVSTVEKRFNLRSAEMGIISGCYDLGVLLALPVVAYIGGRGHKPLWLGWGTMLMGAGSVVFCLPHFLAPEYDPSESKALECGRPVETDCGPTTLRPYRWFFMLSQLLVGFGACPIFTLGITYLDANVKQAYSSLYHGILFSLYALGPGVGYIAGGYLLTYYTYPFQSVEVSPLDEGWIGNWWIGFLFVGLLCVLISVPLLMFPSKLPNYSDASSDRESELCGGKDAMRNQGDESLGKSIRDAPKCLLLLLKNPTVMLISVSGAMDFGVVSGMATFGPKYVESTFSVSPSFAAVCFGVLAILAIGVGSLLGGYIVTKFAMTVPQILRLCIGSSALALAGLFVFLFTCKNPDFAGITTGTASLSVKACESACGCTTDFFDPVCGPDQITYVSFCDAGCVKLKSEDSELRYTNCTNLPFYNGTDSRALEVAPGKCVVESCPSITYFLVIAGFTFFALVVKDQPALQASLRSVPFHQRSLAVGLQGLVLRVLGPIPIPVVIGKVLDTACLVWSKECGECGSCKLYDNVTTSRYLTATCVSAKSISLIAFLFAAKTYKRMAPTAEGDAPGPVARRVDEVEKC